MLPAASSSTVCCICGKNNNETVFKRNFKVKAENLDLYRAALPAFAKTATVGTTCESCYKAYYAYRRTLKTPVKRSKAVLESDDEDVNNSKNSKKKSTTTKKGRQPSPSNDSDAESNSSNNNCHASSSEEPVGMCGKGVQKVNLDFNFDETTTTAAEKARSVQQWLDMKDTNFKPVTTLDFSDVNEEIIDFYLYKLGQPIILTNSLEALAKGFLEKNNAQITSSNLEKSKLKQAELFHLNYLRDIVGDLKVYPRDNTTFVDEEMTMKQYINFIQKDNDIRAPNRRLLYGKDITCPKQWKSYLFDNPKFPDKLKYKGPKDILANTNKDIWSITLMIYVGNSETFTPAHKDVCGALGHNLMVYSDNDRTHAIWCIMKYEDLEQIRTFFQKNGAFLDDDNCFLPLHLLSKAPFTVYLFEQKLGDLVLLPPSAPHQVLNMGGKSIKVAWNTLSCLALPYSYEILDEYRKFGKNQVYRIKAVAYYSMLKYSEKAQSFKKLEEIGSTENERKRFSDDMLILLRIFDDILFEESIESDVFDEEIHVSKLPEIERMHSRYCDHCKCDIFNRCFQVEKTKLHHGYDLCTNCVAEGRGSLFGDKMKLMEHIGFSELSSNFEKAKKAYLNVQKLLKTENITTLDDVNNLIRINGDPTKTTSITTIAWNNMYYSKHHVEFPEYLLCHQCDDSKPKYCSKTCSNCHQSYCNQCLWDRYTITLCECSRIKNWTCPQCNNVCNCTECLKQRDIDTLSYSTNILSRMDEIKDVLPFSVLDVSGNESSTRILDGICDFPPQPVKHLTEVKHATRILNSIVNNCPPNEDTNIKTPKKRKILIINKNPDHKEVKIMHNYFHHQKVSVCGNCRRSIATGILFQSKSDKSKFYCSHCTMKNAVDKANLIPHDYLCDVCKNTIIGVRFHHVPTGHDLCQQCYISNSFTNEIREYMQNCSEDGTLSRRTFECIIPPYEDLIMPNESLTPSSKK